MNIQLHLAKAWAHLYSALREAREVQPEPSALTDGIHEAIDYTELATLVYRQWRRAQEAERETIAEATA